MTKTILVTGGAGFVGSHVNYALQQLGYRTVILDNLSRGIREAVLGGTFIQGDLGHMETLDALFTTHRIDAVMHFAAFMDVGESVTHPMRYYRNNVVGTLNLLEAMLKHGVHRFIFSSSAAIFGIPLETRISEAHPKKPISPYGEGKWMVEQMLESLTLSYPLRFCALRYFNAAGGDPNGKIPIKQDNHSNLIPRLLSCILNKQISKPTAAIYGTDYPTRDGTCERDYVHISDLVDVHIAALEQLFAPGPSSRHYNLGNGQSFSVRQVIQTVEKVTGSRLEIEEGPRRAGDPPILIADSACAMRELGWNPKIPDLETIVAHAWQGIVGYKLPRDDRI